MYRISEDSGVYRGEYEVKVYRANSVEEALKFRENYPDFTLFSGGSDVALNLQKETLSGLIDITHLESLKAIKVTSKTIQIGALVTINTILESKEIEEKLPLLHEVCKTFASHQIRNIATIVGNIINDSPVADFIAPLLVLNATITLRSLDRERTVALEELFDGYKSLKMDREIVLGFEVPLERGSFYYRKVGARKQLNITKLSLVLFRTKDRYRVSGASLNSYVQRFKTIEKLLEYGVFSQGELLEAIEKDIAPHSNVEYKKRVLLNMLQDALLEIK